jgi:hypothetical protein
MAPRILTEVMVGLTPEINTALGMACEFTGMKPSQLGRQAILEKLVREQWMVHPAARFLNNPPPVGK